MLFRSDTASVERELARAKDIVDGTGSVLDQAMVRLAASSIWGASARTDAATAEAEALLAGSGVDPVGWLRLFAAMTAPAA